MNKFQAMIKMPPLLIIVFIFIFMIYLKHKPAGNQLTLLSSESTPTTMTETSQVQSEDSSETNINLIMVDIQGEVYQPGVYELPAGSRVVDLIEIAGGLKPGAYERTLNRALILEDQMSIYIYHQEDPNVCEGGDSNHVLDSIQQQNEEDKSNQIININLADATQLQDLKGIGPAKAEAIVTYREENGLFQNIEEIKNVPGIGQKTFENIETMIAVN